MGGRRCGPTGPGEAFVVGFDNPSRLIHHRGSLGSRARMPFIQELKRRNVFRVAVLYVVASWIMLQAADLLFEAMELPNEWLRFVLALLILAFPLVLIFSWVFEMTPEGLKLEKDIDRSESITTQTGGRINYLIVALLVVAIGILILDRLVPESQERPVTEVAGEARSDASGTAAESLLTGTTAVPELSIAVLPFVDMSPEKDQEYFTDGISEELLNLLARVPDFRVAGRTSSFAFKGENEDLRVIGEKLGVSVLLEGSVRKDGDHIRVTAQLIKVDDGYHLWSEAYDRKLENIFALQDDIATKVVAALKTTLLPEQSAAEPQVVTRSQPTDSKEAYASYLRGRHFLRKRSYDDLFQAEEAFKKAVELDPQFAAAYAGLAESYVHIVSYGYRSEDEYTPLMTAALDKALELDPEQSEALAVRGQLLSENARDEEALQVLERAVELNPNNSQALTNLGNVYFWLSRHEESSEAIRRAYEVDPLSPDVLVEMAYLYKEQGNDAGSRRIIEELAALDPDSELLFRARSGLAAEDGDHVNAIKWLHRAIEANPRNFISRFRIATRLMKIGALDAAEKYARQAYELDPKSPRALVRLVDMMQYQGRYDEALAMLDTALETYPNDGLLRSYRITVLHHAERYAEAQVEIEELAPSLTRSPPKFEGPTAFFWSPRYAWMLRRNGEEERARQIFDVYPTWPNSRGWMFLSRRSGAGISFEPGGMQPWATVSR
jgi:TolB-like protein/Flp pilus assembly protein TadD